MKNTVLIFFSMMICFFSYGQIEKTNTNDPDLAKSVDLYMQRAVPFGFSGAILVAKNGHVLLNKGYGYSNRANNKKNTASSVFSTGSVTKQFTAAGIMKLEMQGKLKTEDKLSKYFSNIPADKKEIKIHNLLTHTSGFPIAFSNDDFERLSEKQYLDKTMNSDLAFTPGEGFKYSNIGYVLLALIIEKQSGLSYEEFLNTYLFKPSGMHQTGYSLPKWDKENFVHIYNGDKDNGTTQKFTNPTFHLLGNGGILSTTKDMFLWVASLKNNQVLSKEATKKLFTPFKNQYAYGWDAIDDGNLRQHNGGSLLGCGAEIRWFVKEDLMTMIFSNATINGDQGFSVVRNELEALTFGDDVPLPPVIKKVNIDLSPYTGKYEFKSGSTFKIKGDNSAINLIVDNQELVDFILSPDNYKPGGISVELNDKFNKAFTKALKNNDFSGFEFTGNQKDLKFEIINEINLEGIKTPYHKIIRTTPSPLLKGGFVTDVAINDDPNVEGPALILKIVTNNQKYEGIGVEFGFANPITLSLIPLGENEFQAYSLSSKIGAKIKIEHLNNTEYSFTIGGKSIKVKQIK